MLLLTKCFFRLRVHVAHYETCTCWVENDVLVWCQQCYRICKEVLATRKSLLRLVKAWRYLLKRNRKSLDSLILTASFARDMLTHHLSQTDLSDHFPTKVLIYDAGIEANVLPLIKAKESGIAALVVAFKGGGGGTQDFLQRNHKFWEEILNMGPTLELLRYDYDFTITGILRQKVVKGLINNFPHLRCLGQDSKQQGLEMKSIFKILNSPNCHLESFDNCRARLTPYVLSDSIPIPSMQRVCMPMAASWRPNDPDRPWWRSMMGPLPLSAAMRVFPNARKLCFNVSNLVVLKKDTLQFLLEMDKLLQLTCRNVTVVLVLQHERYMSLMHEAVKNYKWSGAASKVTQHLLSSRMHSLELVRIDGVTVRFKWLSHMFYCAFSHNFSSEVVRPGCSEGLSDDFPLSF